MLLEEALLWGGDHTVTWSDTSGSCHIDCIREQLELD